MTYLHVGLVHQGMVIGRSLVKIGGCFCCERKACEGSGTRVCIVGVKGENGRVACQKHAGEEGKKGKHGGLVGRKRSGRGVYILCPVETDAFETRPCFGWDCR